MLNRIIRILATALGALLLAAGCSKAPYGPASEQETPISFDAGPAYLLNDAMTTRTSPLPVNTHFGVFAFSGGNWSASRKPNFMFNVDVDYDGSTYSYSPIRYWPDTKVSFWAYSPYDSNTSSFYSYNSGTGVFSQYTSNSTNIPNVRFTMTDGQTDFLVSNIVQSQTSTSNSGVVAFTFNHALSLIDFTVEKDDEHDDYEVFLTDISLVDIYFSGICKTDRSWAGHSGGRHTLSVLSGGSQEATGTRTAVSGASVMVIPQTVVNTDAMLRVVYTLELRGSNNPKTNECLLPITNNWASNGHYTYYLQITPDLPIEFTVSWSDWGVHYNYHLGS